MTGTWFRFTNGLICAAMTLAIASLCVNTSLAVLIVSDGFGDGDRDNNGLDSGAMATDPGDVGIPWYLTNGTSAVTFRAIDDSAGIGTGNALQLFNTASNNRPTVGRFSPITMADGDMLILRLDARLVSASPATSDRSIRFGIYNDTLGNFVSGDQGSTSVVYNDDFGYNVRVDAGAEVSNSTSMDVTRDNDAAHTAIIQATTTGIGVSSTSTADRLDDALSHHFQLTLTRSGTSMLVSLQQDSNAAISGTDTSPPSFVFGEIALGVRSSAAMDLRFDNIQLEFVPIPEAANLGILMIALFGMILHRQR